MNLAIPIYHHANFDKKCLRVFAWKIFESLPDHIKLDENQMLLKVSWKILIKGPAGVMCATKLDKLGFATFEFNPFLLIIPFWPPWKHQKTFGFLIFSGVQKGTLGRNGSIKQ